MELEERERVQSSMLMSSANDGCCSPTTQQKDAFDSGLVKNDLVMIDFAALEA